MEGIKSGITVGVIFREIFEVVEEGVFGDVCFEQERIG